ncbi:MAG: N-acetylmuramoyl-L-alanine amidase [Sphingobacteriales bacterium]|nr:N-acetylmuramoyl-L-alanine amidase [Sphingobacteriales bacterium]
MSRKKTVRLSKIKSNNDKIFLYLMSFKCMFKTSKIRIACLIFLLSIHTIGQCVSKNAASYKIKTIVLDAGHGGHDGGCNGSLHSHEKDVTLKVVLALGKMIEEKYPDVKVLYTRKTDVFITLQDRALLANNNNADLFISVHCNSGPSKAIGTETFLMGLHVSQANLDVAKRENAVIKLEENYEKTYEGFDPDSPEAMIALSLAQNANIEQSTFLASKVQEQFTNKLNRFNRGVKQAGFWVLYRTTCPSILIETGFLTNKEEEKFLISKDGQEDIAGAIFHAFDDYKITVEKGNKLIPPVIENQQGSIINDIEPELINSKPIVNTPKTQTPVKQTTEPKETTSEKGIIYKVQIKSTTKLLPKSDKAYDLYSNLKYEKADGVYKYAYAPFSDFDLANKVLKKVKASGYKDAFIVVYKDGKKLSASEAKNYLQ